MTDQAQRNDLRPTNPKKDGAAKPPTGESQLPPIAEISQPAAESEGVTPVDKLTPEEQMARFEKELKEKDWGHQPC